MSLATLETPAGMIIIRRARQEDVGAVIALLAADQLRASVESVAPEHREPYDQAFQLIDADPAQLLVVGTTVDGTIVATMQLTFIPGLARAGALRMQVEAVRVADTLRGQGVGSAVMRWAIDEGRQRGVRLVQLTSDRSRESAHRFYENLGFQKSHVGFKLAIDAPPEH